jgi:hypothetical protein
VFLRFLKLIGTAIPDGPELHLTCDNYATRKTPAIKKRLLRHPRFHVHFTPDQLVVDQPRRAVVRRADQPQSPPVRAPQCHRLEADIRKWINAWYKGPGHTSGPRPPTRSSTPAPPTTDESL